MSDYVSPTDPARVAEAEAIIERVAALKPDHDYETNGLTWAVAAFAVGLTDMVKETEAERDRLRTEVDAIRDTIGHILLALVPQDAPPGIIEFNEDSVVDIVKGVVAERDRLRAVVEALREYHRAVLAGKAPAAGAMAVIAAAVQLDVSPEVADG